MAARQRATAQRASMPTTPGTLASCHQVRLGLATLREVGQHRDKLRAFNTLRSSAIPLFGALRPLQGSRMQTANGSYRLSSLTLRLMA
jgi:hypothetical protein